VLSCSCYTVGFITRDRVRGSVIDIRYFRIVLSTLTRLSRVIFMFFYKLNVNCIVMLWKQHVIWAAIIAVVLGSVHRIFEMYMGYIVLDININIQI